MADEVEVAVRADLDTFIRDVSAGGSDAADAFRRAFEGGPAPDPLGNMDTSAAGEAGDEAGRRFRDGFEGTPVESPLADLDAASDGGRAGSQGGSSFADRFGSAAQGDLGGALGGLTDMLAAAGPWGAAAAAAAAAFGAAFTLGIGNAIAAEEASQRFIATFGLNSGEAERYGQIAGDLYTNAFGDSLEQVQVAVGETATVFPQLAAAGGDALSGATENALNFANAMGVEVADATRAAGLAVETGLAGDATQAFDLITAAAQRVGPSMVDPLLEAANEYGVNFASMGFSGEQAFAVLANASAGGEIALDKAGDAIKEFGIKATDLGDTGAQDALAGLGLSGQQMANDLLAGGTTAQAAFQQIIGGLQGIDDPAEQAAAAVALFGTPVEDLSKDQIPGFLEGLSSAETGLGDFEGAAQRMGDALNDTAAGRIESFKRTVSMGFTNAAGGLLGFLSDGLDLVNPFVQSVMGAFGELDPSALLAPLSGVGAAFTDAFSGIDLSGLTASMSGYLDTWLPMLSGLGESLMSALGPALEQLAPLAAGFIDVLVAGMTNAYTVITSVVAVIGPLLVDVLGGAFTAIGAILTGALAIITGAFDVIAGILTGDWSRVWSGLSGIVSGALDAVVGILTGAGEIILGVLTFLWSGVAGSATAAWNGLVGIVSGALGAALGFITGITTQILVWLLTTWASLTASASGAWSSLVRIVQSGMAAALAFVVGLGASLLASLLSAWANLRSSTTSAWSSFVSTVTSKAGEALAFVASIPGRILSALGGLGGLLVSRGADLINGFRTGIANGVSAVTSFVASIPGRVVAGIGNLSNVLYSAGTSIISGLLSGITAKISSVRSTLQNLTASIPQWKGPPERDADLLRGAGESIIGGFITGLESKYGLVRSSLAGLTDDIAATAMPSITVGDVTSSAVRAGLSTRSAPALAGAAPAGRSSTYNVDARGMDRGELFATLRAHDTTDAVLYGR